MHSQIFKSVFVALKHLLNKENSKVFFYSFTADFKILEYGIPRERLEVYILSSLESKSGKLGLFFSILKYFNRTDIL